MPLPSTRAILLASALISLGTAGLVWQAPRVGAEEIAQAPATIAVGGGFVRRVVVEGNERIEEATVRSYMLIQQGDRFDAERVDRSLKALFSTGLFADVAMRRSGDDLVVRVTENPIINRIAFEGNRALGDEVLRPEVQLRARSVYTRPAVQADTQRLLEIYARRGRFGAQIEPKIIRLAQNRVDLVFEIREGDATGVRRINFVGNRYYSDGRLREVVQTKESRWYRFFSSDDSYDPDRLTFDRELLRRQYLRAGFADFRVASAVAELTEDRRAFFITYTIEEGDRYRVGSVNIDSRLRGLEGDSLRRNLTIDEGDWYNANEIENSVQALTQAVGNAGFAFVDVQPRVVRNRETKTIDITFEVGEGPRVFVERIDIVGNVRTQDRVIRREFRLAEGDAFNAARVRRARQRLIDLQYFNRVTVNTQQGAAPDRTVLQVEVDERATGEFSIGAGFSTDAGALVELGLRERNLVGTGIDFRLATVIAQRRGQLDFSITDPQFLDLPIALGLDIFYIQRNLERFSSFSDKRAGFAVRIGYDISEYLRQVWSYTLAEREVTNVPAEASLFVKEQEGRTLLSQIGTSIVYDRRDSRVDPRDGYVVRLGLDVAGLGGDVRYIRYRADAAYYIPLTQLMGHEEWGLAFLGSAGYLDNLSRRERIVDRFFLGGDSLRGFQSGGVGPRDVATGDSLGGRLLWTASTELRFPLGLPQELGLSGRAFVDIGSLSQVSATGPNVADEGTPRVGAGFGFTWRAPIGVINIDFGQALVKKSYDRTQIVRIGFGTRF
ncbi:MAG: outer membrane protein assembly factor BamA [Alphaproteobacteria bacterium]|nr:outer membrane protein assembly factor BamA [Alphaproteobacteria bacterium]